VADRHPSNTAFGAATMRAVHQLIDEEPKILFDPIVLRLLDASTLDQIHLNPNKFRTPRMKALRSRIVMRSRYTEGRLAEAVDKGVQQYLMLGAGLDTFPFRQPHWARVLRIFEVDHSASQRSKRERLALAGIEVPSNAELVACDFETTSLRDCLRKGSFDSHIFTTVHTSSQTQSLAGFRPANDRDRYSQGQCRAFCQIKYP